MPGDAHSCCNHPNIFDADKLLAPMLVLQGITPPSMKRMNVSADQHGIANGWFLWPTNFDPVWLETCDGMKEKQSDDN